MGRATRLLHVRFLARDVLFFSGLLGAVMGFFPTIVGSVPGCLSGILVAALWLRIMGGKIRKGRTGSLKADGSLWGAIMGVISAILLQAIVVLVVILKPSYLGFLDEGWQYLWGIAVLAAIPAGALLGMILGAQYGYRLHSIYGNLRQAEELQGKSLSASQVPPPLPDDPTLGDAP